MRKEIRQVDPARGIVQITVSDERWYAIPEADPKTGLPSYRYLPSVTWVAGFYPKGPGFYKWLASQGGWDEAQVVKHAAADKGSRIHRAIAGLLEGKAVTLDEPVWSDQGDPAPLTVEEYGAVWSFVRWHQAHQPATLAQNVVVLHEGDQPYAGTIDWLGSIATGEYAGLWLLDFKTSRDVWPEMELQVTAYDKALDFAALGLTIPPTMARRLGILQVGYPRNKAGWKLTEVTPQPELWDATYRIWQKETAGQTVKARDYPLALTL